LDFLEKSKDLTSVPIVDTKINFHAAEVESQIPELSLLQRRAKEDSTTQHHVSIINVPNRKLGDNRSLIVAKQFVVERRSDESISIIYRYRYILIRIC
jgi:hypothetical protein